MAKTVKPIELVKRFEERDIIHAPQTIMAQVLINDWQNPDTGDITKGIEEEPMYQTEGGIKPKNLDEALKNLASNLNREGGQGIQKVTLVDKQYIPNPATGIVVLPEATASDYGVVKYNATLSSEVVKNLVNNELYKKLTEMKQQAGQSFDGFDPTTGAPVFAPKITEVDGQFNTGSSNPLQNKVITNALNTALGESVQTAVQPIKIKYNKDNAGTTTEVTENITGGILDITKIAGGGKIDGVKVNGTELTIDATKKVDIPAATSSAYGVVKLVDTYSSTGVDAVSGKALAAALDTLDLTETGGTDKIITTVKQENGVVTATAKDAVKKETPAAANAREYTIAGCSTKVEIPVAVVDTSATPDKDKYGAVVLDDKGADLKTCYVNHADLYPTGTKSFDATDNTQKTDDAVMMTGKAIMSTFKTIVERIENIEAILDKITEIINN